MLPLPRRMIIRSRSRCPGAASVFSGAGRRLAECVPLAFQAGNPAASLDAICGLEQQVIPTLRHHDQIFLAIPEQSVSLGAPAVLPFVEFRLSCCVLAYPTDTLALAQVRLSVFFGMDFGRGAQIGA